MIDYGLGSSASSEANEEDDLNLDRHAETESIESLLQGLAFSDTTMAILNESIESITLFASEMIVDFETQLTLIVESYRSDLTCIVQETLRQRRRRRRASASHGGGSVSFRFKLSDEVSHQPRMSFAALSELSRTATDVASEIERRQRDQRRRVKRKAILLAPLVFVDRKHRYTLPSLSSAAFTARFETPMLVVEQQPPRQQPQSPPMPRRRKRSHRGFETFSQVESSSDPVPRRR